MNKLDEQFLEHESFPIILDALLDGVTVYDGGGTLVWINTKACQLFGFERKKLIGMNISEIATLPTVDALITDELAGRSLSDVRRHNRQVDDYASPGYMIFKNGERLLYTGAFIRKMDGAVRWAIYTLRDTTGLDDVRLKIDELQKLTSLYRDQLQALHTHALGQDIVYCSKAMQGVLERALKIARLDGNVLISGETGVGKNLLARYLHVTSRRDRGPFIHINCANLPESLVESELFGYAEGAFTGAVRKGRRGLIEQGNHGTVFLDEISEMSRSMQAKLLTVIEDKTMRRIGGGETIKLDLRFIAATNKDLEELRDGGAIRPDLYYRIATSRLHIPALRERRDDIPCLTKHILAEFNSMNGTDLSLRDDVIDMLTKLPLPGNTREIKNLIWEIAAAVDPGATTISRRMLPDSVAQVLAYQPITYAAAAAGKPVADDAKDGDFDEMQRLCRRFEGDVYAIAEALGVHRTTVIRKLNRLGISYNHRRARNS
jgi:PAS domain S-box-containing protein